MKKIFIAIYILTFFFQISAYASNSIDFIYINGSNNNNTKMYNWFLHGINRFHPELKKNIEKNAYMCEHFLKNGKYIIDEKPSNFFLGV